MQEGSLFSIPFPAFIACRLSDDGYSDLHEAVSHCHFDLHFSIMSDIEHLFICLYLEGRDRKEVERELFTPVADSC